MLHGGVPGSHGNDQAYSRRIAHGLVKCAAVAPRWRLVNTANAGTALRAASAQAHVRHPRRIARGDLRFGTYQAFFIMPKTLYKLIQRMQESAS